MEQALQEIADNLSQYEATPGSASPEDVNDLLTKIAQRVNEAGDFGAPREVVREIRCA